MKGGVQSRILNFYEQSAPKMIDYQRKAKLLGPIWHFKDNFGLGLLQEVFGGHQKAIAKGGTQ